MSLLDEQPRQIGHDNAVVVLSGGPKIQARSIVHEVGWLREFAADRRQEQRLHAFDNPALAGTIAREVRGGHASHQSLIDPARVAIDTLRYPNEPGATLSGMESITKQTLIDALAGAISLGVHVEHVGDDDGTFHTPQSICAGLSEQQKRGPEVPR
jgi:hypothetical protein